MLSEFRLSVSIGWLLGSKAGACSKVGDGEMCLTGVSEHTILLELKMCQEGIAADATDYCKGLHLTVPLLKLNEFLQDGCYGEFLHQKAHFETGLAFVL